MASRLAFDRFLGDLEHRLASAGDVLASASLNMAEETIDLIKQGFVDEKDPYGDPWPPKKRRDGRKTLSGPTGRLKTGWKRAKLPNASGFTVSASVDYAIYHQDPQPRRRRSEEFIGPMGLTRPKRAMVPDERGLPKRWSDAYEEIAIDALREHFAR